MRRAAGLGILVLVGAVVVPVATATPVAAASPTLGAPSPSSGDPGTTVTYTYTWDPADCTTNMVADGDSIILVWDSPSEQLPSSGTIANNGTTCMGNVSAQVPANSTTGDNHFPTAFLQNSSGVGDTMSQTGPASSAFFVAPPPTPTPTPRPTPTPTPRPTPTPTPRPTSGPPTPTPLPTPKPTPTPTPLPTPPAFISGGGGGGSGGGSPQGGAACSGGIGRSPTSAELTAAIARLTSGTDPTAIQIGLLASAEYYHDTGGTPLDFVNRLYDDVLRHDPTPVEVAMSLTTVSTAGDVGRLQLVQDVVYSPEARAIRVDQGFHTLLNTYPSSAQLAIWVNRLASSGGAGLSENTMIEEIAASAAYFALVGSKGSTFISRLYQDLLSRPPTSAELAGDATLVRQIDAAGSLPRLLLAENVVAGSEFRGDQVKSFYANYLHSTCPVLVAQECPLTLGSPTSAELSSALTALAGNSAEEDIIAGVLGSDQYYLHHGSTEAGLVKAVYQDLLGRSPTNGEMSAALQTYPNDPLGHLGFAQALVQSSEYKDLVVSFDYQQLLLRAARSAELLSGEGILGGDIPSLDTPDQTLLEQIVATPEYYADTGGTDSRFVVRTISTLLMQAPTTEDALQYLHQPPPHDAKWQLGVARSIIVTPSYETDFVRGVYEKFLTYALCTKPTPPAVGGGSSGGFIKNIPGGWFGAGVLAGVLLLGAAVAAFFALERKRFSTIYPDEVRRPHA